MNQRKINFIDTFNTSSVNFKFYGISHSGDKPNSLLLNEALRLTKSKDLSNVVNPQGYGFCGVHEGVTANFVFLGVWGNVNELWLYTWTSSLDDPTNFILRTGEGLLGCCWDLRVISYERDLWYKYVVQNKDKPDYSKYFEESLDEMH